MNLTAGVRKLLIKAAHANPELRADILPLVQDPNFEVHYGGGQDFSKLASHQKVALSKESEAFIAWALIRNEKLEPNKFQKVVERLTGREPSTSPLTRRKAGSPFEVGEKVIIDKHKNANEHNVDLCEAHHNQEGYVDSVASDSCVISFGSVKVKFDGNTSGKKTGIYRNNAVSTEGRKQIMIEAVYLKGTNAKVPERNKESIQEYLDRGTALKQNRDLRYYSGTVGYFGFNKKKQVFCQIQSQQRNYALTFNPAIGKCLYFGQLGKRPPAWKSEAIELGILA